MYRFQRILCTYFLLVLKPNKFCLVPNKKNYLLKLTNDIITIFEEVTFISIVVNLKMLCKSLFISGTKSIKQ